jgi:hypothetical protein
MTGTATANPSTLNFTAANETGTFSLDPLGNTPVALASLAGNYLAAADASSKNRSVTMTIDPPPNGLATAAITGVFDPNGANQAFTGTITPVASAVNAFQVVLTTTSAPGVTATTSGLAYLRSTTPPSLIVMTDDGNPNQSQILQTSAIFTTVP